MDKRLRSKDVGQAGSVQGSARQRVSVGLTDTENKKANRQRATKWIPDWERELAGAVDITAEAVGYVPPDQDATPPKLRTKRRTLTRRK